MGTGSRSQSSGTTFAICSGGLVSLKSEEREKISRAIRSCGESDPHTDILAALEYGLTVARSTDEVSRRAFPMAIVLLTDGRDEPRVREAQRAERTTSILESYAAMGIPIYALGLSDGADRDLLGRLCAATGGDLALASSARDLPSGFFNISRGIGRRWLLFEGDASPGELAVTTPAWAPDVLVALFPATPCTDRLSLDGARELTVRPRFQLMMARPGSGGQLVVQIPSPGGKVLVTSQGDLVLSPKIPKCVPVGIPFPCAARLACAAAATVKPAAFIDRSTATLEWAGQTSGRVFLYDDGAHGDQEQADGEYGGTAVLSEVGEVTFEMTLTAPFSPRLRASANCRAVGEPLRVELPTYLSSAWSSLSDRFAHVRVHNETSVDLPVRVECGGPEISVTTVRGEREATVPVSVTGEWFRSRRARIVLRHVSTIQPLWEGDVTVPARSTIPASVVAILAAAAACAVFPRRTIRGVQVRVAFPIDDDSLRETRTCSCNESGALRFEGIPEPYNEPGLLRAIHGIWRTGVVFEPAAHVNPRFKGRTPDRVGNGFVLRSGAEWTVAGPAGTARYILTMR
ncbi:MAG: VWA domain-containing protein [Candidatus Eisenbacteria bacterium]|nr:VWA domain-containing protein [Candidatus Eisenbacteria bacterium]